MLSNMCRMLNVKISKNMENILLIPPIIGSCMGGIYYGYHYFLKTKHQIFAVNTIETISGIILGGIYGGLCGFLWPVTSLVYYGRILHNKNEY